MARPLAALAQEYERLSALLVELSHVSQRWAEQPDRPQQLQALIEDEARGVQRLLFDLAWQVAETQGQSLGDLIVKAWVLRDWCEHDQGDLVGQLTLAVCDDIVRLGTQSGEPTDPE